MPVALESVSDERAALGIRAVRGSRSGEGDRIAARAQRCFGAPIRTLDPGRSGVPRRRDTSRSPGCHPGCNRGRLGDNSHSRGTPGGNDRRSGWRSTLDSAVRRGRSSERGHGAAFARGTGWGWCRGPLRAARASQESIAPISRFRTGPAWRDSIPDRAVLGHERRAKRFRRRACAAHLAPGFNRGKRGLP
jgi:hypothetical protein